MDIVTIARSYIGQREKPNNSGFMDRMFEEEMRLAGWKRGEPWCAYFVRLCVRKARLRDVTSPSAVQTYMNYRKAELVSGVPYIGSLAVWRRYSDGKKTGQGHIGIVSEYVPGTDVFTCIEGNTNGAGSREGDRVGERTRKLSFEIVPNGLTLLGFVIAPGV